ncbi:MAG: hypothetical protein K8R77_07150 [Anaerolineaceae bacterium]|nr:hypothetical protein [Anaerolineaceae bacterium]
MSATNWQRWLFWLILGAFSVFFAEVLATSDPFVFFHFFGLLGVFPHYTLHVLVLAPLVVRLDRRVRFGALFLAGTIFGLYEAYMTKVLWSPPWNPDAFRLGGVAVITSAMLVLFWHPFFSFLVPLFVADHLLLDSDRLSSSLPALARRLLRKPWFVTVAAVAAGILHGSRLDGPVTALTSAASTSGMVLLLLFIWDTAIGTQQFELAELLPRGKTWWVCLFLLLGYYLAFGITLNPELLPGWGPQVVIWGLYLLFGGLMWLILRKAPPEPIVPGDEGDVLWDGRKTARRWLSFALTFTASSTIAALLLAWAGEFILALVWFLGILFGMFALGYAFKQAFSRQRAV